MLNHLNLFQMGENPWQVDSIQAFLCFKCPECIFNTKKEDILEDPAIENHPLSLVLFSKTIKEEIEIEDIFLSTETSTLNDQSGNENIATVDPISVLISPNTVIHSLITETLKEESSELITSDLYGKSEISIDPVDIPEISIEFDWQTVKKEQEENDIDYFVNTDNFETDDNSKLTGENAQVGSDHEGYGMNKHISQQHNEQNVKITNMAPEENQKPVDDNILDLNENLTLETEKIFFGRTDVSEDQNVKSFHSIMWLACQ